MSSIPLPALHVNPPPPQADPLEQYGRLMALKNQMTMAPLQQQAMQQQVQTGAVDLQQKQQAMKDQQAVTVAMHSWDGKDYNDILPLAIKNGASAQTIMAMKKNILDQQVQLSTMVKNNGEGAAAQMNANKMKGDRLDGALTPLTDPKQVPDAQLPQTIQQTAQDLMQQGILDPQHAQAAAQLAQLAQTDPGKARQQLDLMRKTNMAQSQIMEDAAKQAGITKDYAQAGEATAATQKTQNENSYYAQNGGASGVPVETQELNDFLKKNPGKTASDFVTFKAKNSPSVIVQNQAAGSAPAAGGTIDWNKAAQRYGMSTAAFDQAAEKFASTGQLPQIGRSANAIAMNRDLMNRAAELHPGASLAENSAEYKANSDSLKKVQSNYDTVAAFESTAEKNMNLLQQTAQNIPDLGTKFANVPVRMISGGMIGTENMARFKTALNTAQTEAAKVLNSSNANGVLSDSARHELQTLVDGNAPYKTIVASLDVLRQDMQNRSQSYQDQINTIKGRIGGGGSQSSTGARDARATPSIGDIKKFPNGKIGKWDGTGWEAQ